MSKDKRSKETAVTDPQWGDAEFSYQNRLQLPLELKKVLKEKGLDFRFLNAGEYRAKGNYHHSHWRPYVATPEEIGSNLYGVTAEGMIQRGDLILGVRPKAISVKHRESLEQRNKVLAGYGQAKAKEMREHVRKTGLGDHVSVEEGYGQDED